MPLLSIADLKTVLDEDLAVVLRDGELFPDTPIGISIGVVQHGSRHIFSYGSAKPDSIFEIGSITKTFTGLLLAQMAQQHLIRLDEPVRDLLPPATVAKAAGAEITLLDLSSHHSGLPPMPRNFHPGNPRNPFADYDAKLLYAEIGQQGVEVKSSSRFDYSNLGAGLLGHALSNRSGLSYSELLRQQITLPLGMSHTVVALTPALQARLIQGYTAAHEPADAWDLDALVGAGGIRSTSADMLTYLEAQLHPDRIHASLNPTLQSETLPSAIVQSHILHGEVDEDMHIALNWFQYNDTGSFWHNGGTGGYTSFALFNAALDFAVVVLSNVGPGSGFTDDLGLHITKCLEGKPIVSFAPSHKTP